MKIEDLNKNLEKKAKIKRNDKKRYKKKNKIKKTTIKNKNYSIDIIQTNSNIKQNISKDLDINSKNIINSNDKLNAKMASEYNIFELNDLEHSEALKKDKRNFLEYYISIIKKKHILFFTFCKKDDYNSRIIKIFLFFYSFVIYFFVNTLFFNDSTMHKIYLDVGIYNFTYQISQIIYSILISSVLNLFARALALTNKNIINLKKDIENNNNKKKLIKCLFYKFIIFFIVSFCLLLLFWYYISSFCAIYINTQAHLIADTLISFALSMIYPLGIYLISGTLRIIALRKLKEDGKILYYLSYLIQYI